MKKLIYFLSIALIFAAACSEEEDTFQNPENQDTVKNKPESNTKILTGKQDVLDTNTFSVFQSGSKRITYLDCYIEISSQFEILDMNGKNIRTVGCVYSNKEKSPVIDGSNCETTNSNHTEIKSQSDKEITFKSGLHNLDFNTDYYVRSYVILEDENHNPCDTVYNQKVTKVHSISLGDIWIQRNDASFGSRMDAISCTVGERVYLYGGRAENTYFNDMWVYNKDNDTWEQKATFEVGQNSHYTGTERRSNGAAFAYPIQNDDLIYILGGEIEGKKPTEKVIFYSTANDRYCDEKDHPNYGIKSQYYKDGRPQYEQKAVLDEEGNLMYDLNGNLITEDDRTKPIMVSGARSYIEDLPHPVRGNAAFVVNTTIGERYYVGFGKDDKDAMATSFYEYDVFYDWYNSGNPNYHILTWKSAGDISGYGEGLYQPVCEVCGSKIIVGTGESSNGGLSKKIYQLNVNNMGTVNMSSLTDTPADFPARANAASFYLKYEKNGEPYERFYIGTGRTFEEGGSGNLLGDLWYYDFNREEWGQVRDFSNSTYAREGATGFATTRKDDFDKDISGILTEEVRGIFTLGYGYHNESAAEKTYYKDCWEYLP
jgi:hypothetical protein